MSEKTLVSKRTHNNMVRETEKAKAKLDAAQAVYNRKKAALDSVELEPQRQSATTTNV